MSQQNEMTGQEVASLAKATSVLDGIFGTPAAEAPAPE